MNGQSTYIAYGPASGLVYWLVQQCTGDPASVVVIPEDQNRDSIASLIKNQGWKMPEIVSGLDISHSGAVYYVAPYKRPSDAAAAEILDAWRKGGATGPLFYLAWSGPWIGVESLLQSESAGYDAALMMRFNFKSTGPVWDLRPLRPA